MTSCKPTLVALVAFAIVTATSGPAAAERRIFVNGVDLTDTEIVNQSFAGCTVRFDAKGDVHIVAKGLKVAKQPATSPAKRPAKSKTTPAAAKRSTGKLTRRYFLTSHESARGTTEYDVEVRINGRRVTTIRSNAAPAAIDVTSFVRPGDNKVQLLANKRKGSRRRSTSAKHTLFISVGEGKLKRGNVTVTKALFDYARTAAETGSFNHIKHFTGR